MARKEARIFTSIWDDKDFAGRSGGAQWLYFVLLSQPDLTQCGVLHDFPPRWADKAGDVTERQVVKWREELTEARFVLKDPTTGELLIRSLVRRDGSLDSPNLTVAVSRTWCAVASSLLRMAVVQELQKEFPEGLREGLAKRLDKPDRKPIWERLDEPFRDAVTCASPTHLNHPITN